MKQKRARKGRRAGRTRATISGTAARPRLSVYRSLKHISVQAIDDEAGKTLAAVSDKHVDAAGKNPTEVAALVGAEVAKKLLAMDIKTVIFDRGSFLYHGRVKALAEGAREGGLEF